jgi:hypothetical protein
MPDSDPIRRLLVLASHALGIGQKQLGEMLGSSHRTAHRWQVGQSHPTEHQLHELARKVYPQDPALAAQIAQAGDTTLEALGVVAPPPPPPPLPPVVAPPAPPPPPPRPPAEEMIDAVVCAAAEAMNMMPAEIRPGLLAAATRGRKLSMTMAEAERGLLATMAASDDKGRRRS